MNTYVGQKCKSLLNHLVPFDYRQHIGNDPLDSDRLVQPITFDFDLII